MIPLFLSSKFFKMKKKVLQSWECWFIMKLTKQIEFKGDVLKMAYNMTEKKREADQKAIKQFTLTETNAKYVDSFRNTRYPEWATDVKQKASWAQYKCSVGNFLESVQKDAVTITETDLAIFVNSIENEKTRANRIAHIKSFLTHLIKNNVENCNDRITKEVLIMVISI